MIYLGACLIAGIRLAKGEVRESSSASTRLWITRKRSLARHLLPRVSEGPKASKGHMSQAEYKSAPKKVLVVIVSLPDESLRVSVANTRGVQGEGVWVKTFQSKGMCLPELKALGLLTELEVTEAHQSDFEKRTAILKFRTVAQPDALQAAQFVYTKITHR